MICYQVQHYILVVQATDGGIPALSSTVTVYCNVVDLNDNAPIFEPGPYAADVLENATIGTAVLSATAQDLDSGDNGKVIYVIASGDDNNDFDIAPNGTVYTKKLLDRESKPLYNLVLSAIDSPAPPARPLSSTVQVHFIYFLVFIIYLLFIYLLYIYLFILVYQVFNIIKFPNSLSKYKSVKIY